MRHLSGRTAIVTGASRGLGLAIAHELARHGANVCLVARGPHHLDNAARGIRREHPDVNVLAVAADVTDPDDRLAILEEPRARVGQPSILVNCAAIGRFVPSTAGSSADVLATNLQAPSELTRLAVDEMAHSGGGAILNVASLAGYVGLPNAADYSASKAGLIAFSKAVSDEVRGSGVTVTVASPGFMVDAGMYVPYDTPPPWYFGSNTTGRVARKAIRAMLRGRPEVIINSRPVRPLLLLGLLSERAMRSATRMLGMNDYLAALGAQGLPNSDAPELIGNRRSPRALAG